MKNYKVQTINNCSKCKHVIKEFCGDYWIHYCNQDNSWKDKSNRVLKKNNEIKFLIASVMSMNEHARYYNWTEKHNVDQHFGICDNYERRSN